jgi:hypothetical protein
VLIGIGLMHFSLTVLQEPRNLETHIANLAKHSVIRLASRHGIRPSPVDTGFDCYRLFQWCNSRSLMLLHPHHLAGAVLFRVIVPLVPDLIRDLSHLSVFIGGAGLMSAHSLRQAEERAALFKSCGADVTISSHKVHASSGTMTFKPPNIGWLGETFDEELPRKLGSASEAKEGKLCD